MANNQQTINPIKVEKCLIWDPDPMGFVAASNIYILVDTTRQAKLSKLVKAVCCNDVLLPRSQMLQTHEQTDGHTHTQTTAINIIDIYICLNARLKIRPLQHNSLFLITTIGAPGCGRAVNIISHYLYIYTHNLNAERRTRG